MSVTNHKSAGREAREKIADVMRCTGRPMSIDDLRLALPELAQGAQIGRAASHLVRDGRLRSLCFCVYVDAMLAPARPDGAVEAIRAAGRRLTISEMAKAVGLSAAQIHELAVTGVLAVDFRNRYYVVADEPAREAPPRLAETLAAQVVRVVEERGEPTSHAEIRRRTGCSSGVIAYLVRTGAIRSLARGLCGPRTSMVVDRAATLADAWCRLRALGAGPHDKPAVRSRGISQQQIRQLVHDGFAAEVAEGSWQAVDGGSPPEITALGAWVATGETARKKRRQSNTMCVEVVRLLDECGGPMAAADLRKAVGCSDGILDHLVKTRAIRRVAGGVYCPLSVRVPATAPAPTQFEAWRRLLALGDGPHGEVAIRVVGILKQQIDHLVRGGFAVEVDGGHAPSVLGH